MAEEGKTVGELRETGGEINVEWEIKNFFDLFQEEDEVYDSPVFYFSDATWYLRIFPNGESHHKSERYIGIYLLRDDPGSPKSVEYEISLTKADGTKEEVCKDKATFDEQYSGWGTPTAFLRSMLLEEKLELVPFGALTIFCSLKKDTHSLGTKLFQDLDGLMLNGDDSDVTVRVNAQEFRLHRCILGARSPVFNSMFKHEMREKTTGTVTIDDCEADTFHVFLGYVYTGAVDKFSPENAFGLYKLADKYQMDELKVVCLEYMKKTLSVDTFFDAIALAWTYEEEELMDLAVDFLSDMMAEIFTTEKWQDFLKEHPTQTIELLIKAAVKKKINSHHVNASSISA